MSRGGNRERETQKKWVEMTSRGGNGEIDCISKSKQNKSQTKTKHLKQFEK